MMSLVKKFEKNARETIIGKGTLRVKELARSGASSTVMGFCRVEFADAVRYTNYFLPPAHRIQFLTLDYTALVRCARYCDVGGMEKYIWTVENEVALPGAS